MLSVSRHIDAPADAVWKVLVDTDAWPQWGPSVAGAEVDGGGLSLGATGRVRSALGVEADAAGCRASMAVPWWAPAYLAVCAIALQRIDRMVR